VVKFMKIKNRYHFVVHCQCNLGMLRSELGSALMDKYKNADFIAVYSIKSNGVTTFSLRSDNDHVDVSNIANILHGGGHRNASGVSVECPTVTLPGVIINTDCLYMLMNSIYFNIYNEYSVVYLMTTMNKRAIGRYLLQDRVIGVQNCMAICENNGIT